MGFLRTQAHGQVSKRAGMIGASLVFFCPYMLWVTALLLPIFLSYSAPLPTSFTGIALFWGQRHSCYHLESRPQEDGAFASSSDPTAYSSGTIAFFYLITFSCSPGPSPMLTWPLPAAHLEVFRYPRALLLPRISSVHFGCQLPASTRGIQLCHPFLPRPHPILHLTTQPLWSACFALDSPACGLWNQNKSCVKPLKSIPSQEYCPSPFRVTYCLPGPKGQLSNPSTPRSYRTLTGFSLAQSSEFLGKRMWLV